MGSQFIRVLREDKEILININSIWKVEIKYAMKPTKPGEVPGYCSVSMGITNPDAIRVYTVFVGGEHYSLAAKPGSKVMQVLEEMYKNAIVDEPGGG